MTLRSGASSTGDAGATVEFDFPGGPDAGSADGPGPTSGLGSGYPEFNFDRGQGRGDSAGGTADPEADDAGAESTPVQGPEDGPTTEEIASGDGADRLAPGVEKLLSPDGPELLSYDADVDRVVDRLYKELERKMRIERERRGL